MNDTTPTEAPSYTRTFVRGLLTIVLIVLLGRLMGFAYDFAGKILQLDFVAFFIAGRAVNQGLSPYVNHIDQVPAIWDGIAGFHHSRYLYPPPSARVFQLLAYLPFSAAKTLWTVLAVAGLGVALFLSLRRLHVDRDTDALLVTSIVAAGSYPVLGMLERGQIDWLTLLLLLLAIGMLERPRGEWAAGGLVALASLFKPTCAFMVVFLAARRRFKAALGFVAGVALIAGLALVIDGPRAVSNYVWNELPRIAKHGEGGTEEMRPPREAFIPLIAGGGPGHTEIDGAVYKRQRFRFVLNATPVQMSTGQRLSDAIGSPAVLALLLLGVGGGIAAAWLAKYGRSGLERLPGDDFLYWQFALIWTLLCGPVTWAMATVWALPLAGLIYREARRLESRAHAVWLVVVAVGLLGIVMPDGYGNFMLAPFAAKWLNHKYVVAELICIVGLLGLWRSRSSGGSAQTA